MAEDPLTLSFLDLATTAVSYTGSARSHVRVVHV